MKIQITHNGRKWSLGVDDAEIAAARNCGPVVDAMCAGGFCDESEMYDEGNEGERSDIDRLLIAVAALASENEARALRKAQEYCDTHEFPIDELRQIPNPTR